MKTIITLLLLIPILNLETRSVRSPEASPSEYEWVQVTVPGNGCYQEECAEGQWPMAIEPVLAFGNQFWFTGQKKIWVTPDAGKWEVFDKKDWGERISMAFVYFNNKLWMSGGMNYPSKSFLNDIWYTADGKNWEVASTPAAWQPRKGHRVVAYRNKLWLFGGATHVNEDLVTDSFLNDVWTSDNGLHWTLVTKDAPWPARDNAQVVVFKDQLFLLGGPSLSDVWTSDDGQNWEQLASESPWKNRYDYGVIVYDNSMWIFGGSEPESHKALNDVWFSDNGYQWRRQAENAPWSPRSGYGVVKENKLWIFSGKRKGYERVDDIWVMQKITD